ncbi:MAG: hypothetical protein H7175_10380 [Burkholderiales bacterium]|nr:hypothetical protein [Anaerolineae bacterium]
MPEMDDILKLLWPSDVNPLWNIFLYVIFFLSFVTLLLIPDKNMTSTVIIGIVILTCIIDLLQVFKPRAFGTLMLHIAMFALPLIAVGMVRVRAGKTVKAMVPAILTAIFGGLYFFIFWLVEQRS